MNGTVELRQGDLLQHIADLAVLPCSTSGTVSSFVRRLLSVNGLPGPRPEMPLGTIEIRQASEVETLAGHIAWAASVQNNWSSLNAVHQIARSLGEVTQRQPEIKHITAPLLGTVAGGLVPRDVLKAMQSAFMETAAPDAKLSLFVLDEAQFMMLCRDHGIEDREDNRCIAGTALEPPRVFVSYAGTKEGTAERVSWFATMLRTRGINARLDQFHLRLGADLPQWMTNEIQQADRVLIVTDELYAERADGRLGGVGWETMIMQSDLSKRPVDDIKYLGVVISNKFDDSVPIYLKTKYLLHWGPLQPNKQLEDKLCAELLGVTNEPPLGFPNL